MWGKLPSFLLRPLVTTSRRGPSSFLAPWKPNLSQRSLVGLFFFFWIKSFLVSIEMADEMSSDIKVFLSHMLLTRRGDIRNAIVQRRNQIQRRIKRRKYFLKRMKRVCLMPTAPSSPSQPWASAESTDWWDQVVMKEFQHRDWVEKFRMSKETFFLVCNKLKPRLARMNTNFRQAVPVEKRVAVVLWRLATNVDYRGISTLFGMAMSTVCQCVRDVCHAIVLLLKPLYMQQPSEQELDDTSRNFSMRWGFPHCVGAIDSLHIPIITPPKKSSDCLNSNGWHSVVMQAVVNGLGQFWDVCAGFPGSTDDATILLNSTLWTTASDGGLCPQSPKTLIGHPLKYILLADAAYPLQSWLLKCYPDSPLLKPCQREFNYRLNQARGVIENAFQRLKARWQCLHKRNSCRLDLIPTMILACCILHNVCEVHHDTFLDEWLEELSQPEGLQPIDMVPPYMDNPDAEEVRSLLCDYFQQEKQHRVPDMTESSCSTATSSELIQTTADILILL